MAPETQPNYPVQPMKPGEVLATKYETIPEEAFIAMNGLIAERIHGVYAEVTMKSLLERMVELGLDKQEIKKRNWHLLGSMYKSAGWDVSYCAPSEDSYNFDPYYRFTTRGERVW